MEDAGIVIDTAVELPDLIADKPLGIGMCASLGRRRLDARDPSLRDNHVQRTGVWTIHRASGANSSGHKNILTIVFAGCTSIHTGLLPLRGHFLPADPLMERGPI